MSHVTTELHEKYKHEHIEDWEHDVVKEEMSAIRFAPEASQNGADHRLPRACYFRTAGTSAEVERAWQNIRRRLGREVSIELTIGSSYGFGLKPVENVTLPAIAIPSILSSLVAGPPLAPKYNSLFGLGNGLEPSVFGALIGLMEKPK